MNTKPRPGQAVEGVRYCIRYLRVSTVRQTHTDADILEDGNSIDTQRKTCMANEKRLGLICIAEYIEPGTSAQSIKKRKEFKKVLKRLNEDRDAQVLSIYMRSRAFRDYIEAGQTERELEAIGVKMVSAKEEFGDDLNGQFMKAMTDVMNWYEAKRNGVDIKEKMANKVKNGGTPSLTRLGYRNVTIEQDFKHINTVRIDEERQPQVLQAFQLMATARYTLETLQEELTAAGFRTRPTKRYPNGNPIGLETLRKMLRSRYYIGWVEVDGIEYKGRHETFISEDLFERVQRVLDSHQGAGVRERKHLHYLKGWLWCNRCGNRFIVQRAMGNGGEYFYFFCRGRQDHSCDQPYIPTEVMEEAITRHYRADVQLPQSFLDELRAMIDEAAAEDFQLTAGLRDHLGNRLDALDRKESYYLDLAAEEGWPKDKLRTKLTDLRVERVSIQRKLNESETALDTGKAIFYRVIDMLRSPGEFYAKGDETVKTAMNRAIFTRFMIDGDKVAVHEMAEPFDMISKTHQRTQRRSYQRVTGGLQLAEPTEADLETWAFDLANYGDLSVGPRGGRARAAQQQVSKSPALQNGAHELSSTDLLDVAFFLRVNGSSKPVVVGATGIEPVTLRL